MNEPTSLFDLWPLLPINAAYLLALCVEVGE